MAREIYVNMAVKDLNKSMQFFENLGFEFNPQFTNDQGACMVIGDNIYAMLLVQKFFKTFTPKEICDSTKSTEVILAISAESREKVNEVVHKAFEAGAKKSNEPQDYGWMYGWSFQDLDGHLWEVLYADPSAMPQG